MAEQVLHVKNYVSCIDVLLGIGCLDVKATADWRTGKVPYLEKVIQGNLNKITWTLKCFRSWAFKKSLKPSETVYHTYGGGAKRTLRFSKSGEPGIEKSYRTHYVLPQIKKVTENL